MNEPAVAVVTGAASGIGFALSRRLSRLGYRVAMSDVRGDSLEMAAQQIRDTSHQAELLPIPTDVTDAAAVDSLARRVEQTWAPPNLVINNAGVIGPVGPVWEGDLEDWHLAMRVNYWGVLHGMRSFLPGMIEHNAGRLVNVASVASWSSAPRMGSYGSAKHAVLALTESAHRELQEMGSAVKLSLVCPTTVRTSLVAHLDLGSADPIGRERLLAARERGLDPEEVAELVVDGVQNGDYLITTDRAWIINAARQRLTVAEGGDPPLDREPPTATRRG